MFKIESVKDKKSIAEAETRIAYILNEEGKKLQKIIACSDNVCSMLKVNKSVNKAIIKATYCEHLLYHKLSSNGDCCDLYGYINHSNSYDSKSMNDEI